MGTLNINTCSILVKKEVLDRKKWKESGNKQKHCFDLHHYLHVGHFQFDWHDYILHISEAITSFRGGWYKSQQLGKNRKLL